jgi:molybdate/tungstate transport system substrate-binding protein
MARLKVLLAALVLLLLVCGYFFVRPAGGKLVLTIFHAGSLAVPFRELEEAFERANPDVDLRREVAGSVLSARKVVELGKRADVLAVSDYKVIESLLLPAHAHWYVKFASNAIVLAYSAGSRYAAEINASNWHEVLQRGGVKFGFSNPNDDPCGYRALIAIQLAELYYNESDIFEKLVSAHTAITCVEEDGKFVIAVPSSAELAPARAKVRIRSMETELLACLELGELDYLFIYRSLALQCGLRFVEFPAEIDLSDAASEELYKRVLVRTDNGHEFRGSAIVYAATVPKVARVHELGVAFIELLLSAEGHEILERHGQEPLALVVASDTSKVPPELARYEQT